MTTTPNPTAEQVVARVLASRRNPFWQEVDPESSNTAPEIVAALRAHGLLSERCLHEAWEENGGSRKCADCKEYLLSEGAPSEKQRARFRAGFDALADDLEATISEEQIERAAVAICVAQDHTGDRECEHDYDAALAALIAAGVAPQEPSASDRDTWLCGKCEREKMLGRDDGQIAEHHRTCSVGMVPTPPTDREKLIAEAREQAAYLRGVSRDGSMPYSGELLESLADALAAQPALDHEYIDIVLDGPPDHESGRFVEVENPAREGLYAGKWIERENGYWALRIPRPQPMLDPEKVAEVIDASAAEWGDSVQVGGVLAQYFARALCEEAKRGGAVVSNYTPTTDQVRYRYSEEYVNGTYGHMFDSRRAEEFDQWLAEYTAQKEREAAARALDRIGQDQRLTDAARDGMNEHGPYPWCAATGVGEFLRARAAEIREGKSE